MSGDKRYFLSLRLRLANLRERLRPLQTRIGPSGRRVPTPGRYWAMNVAERRFVSSWKGLKQIRKTNFAPDPQTAGVGGYPRKKPPRSEQRLAPLRAWIPERSATRLREADLNVLSKLGNQGWNGVLNPRHLRGVRFVVRAISWISWSDVRSISRWRGSHRRKRPLAFRCRLFAMRHKRRRIRSSCRAWS